MKNKVVDPCVESEFVTLAEKTWAGLHALKADGSKSTKVNAKIR